MTSKHYRCPDCKETVRIRTFAPDRVALERERGERFSETCPSCGSNVSLHVNDVFARALSWPFYLVMGVCVLLVVVYLLFGLAGNIYGLILLGGLFGLPTLARRAANRQAESFNAYQL